MKAIDEIPCARSSTAGVVSAPGIGELSIKSRSAALGDVIPPGNVFNITNAFRIQW
ncbi:MAG: hypothetical protein ACKVXR_05065 [Planctomycetota bacterium]